MQVSAKGPFTVTAVNRLFNHTDSLERSTRQKTLEQTLEETQRQLDRLKASREVMDAESELLKTNCSVANRNVATPLAAIRELNEYYAARLETLKSKTLSLDAEEEKINERRRQILAELVNLGGRQSDPMSEVEVRIEAPATWQGVVHADLLRPQRRLFPRTTSVRAGCRSRWRSPTRPIFSRTPERSGRTSP